MGQLPFVKIYKNGKLFLNSTLMKQTCMQKGDYVCCQYYKDRNILKIQIVSESSSSLLQRYKLSDAGTHACSFGINTFFRINHIRMKAVVKRKRILITDYGHDYFDIPLDRQVKYINKPDQPEVDKTLPSTQETPLIPFHRLWWTEIKYFLKVIFTPDCWIRDNGTDIKWDKWMWKALEYPIFTELTHNTVKLESTTIWIQNYPYDTYYSPAATPHDNLPSRRTVLKFHDALKKFKKIK